MDDADKGKRGAIFAEQHPLLFTSRVKGWGCDYLSFTCTDECAIMRGITTGTSLEKIRLFSVYQLIRLAGRRILQI